MALPPPPRRIRRVVLETSLKPFHPFDRKTVEQTCRVLFDQWRPLVHHANELAILLWTADGSEILTWAGNLDQEFRWANRVGFNNASARPYSHPIDEKLSARDFVDNPEPMTYRTLAMITQSLSDVGRELLGIEIQVGATFDPGPEFTESTFKFVDHPEILSIDREAHAGPGISMVRANAALHADTSPYAAYPNGIPEGLSFAEFLARQSRSFIETLGFDYLWLSNGFGFSARPWTVLGEGFDGREFLGTADSAVATATMEFWRTFTEHFALPIEVRGTNFSTGIDLSVDHTPARDIYTQNWLRGSVPNSPWGALNQDIGIELVGYLSRIARLPGEEFCFRFYANDPWFWQNPWWDFYNREPYDIFLPSSLSRLDQSGQIQVASDVEILTIDTERGILDERCAREVSGRIVQARESAPDAPGPIVLVYPFDHYADQFCEESVLAGTPFFEDWFLAASVTAGLPMSTAADAADFNALLRGESLRNCVVITPASALSRTYESDLLEFCHRGGKVLVYGSLQQTGELIRDELGVALKSGLQGDLSLSIRGQHPDGVTFTHVASLSGGGIGETFDHPTEEVTVIATTTDGRDTRGYAAVRSFGASGGFLGWVRGSAPFVFDGDLNRVPSCQQITGSPATVTLAVLSHLGIVVEFERRTTESQSATLTLHRNAGGYWVNGYLPDTTARIRLGMEYGAPILMQQECWYENGKATYQSGKTLHAECRAFVRQAVSGVISARELPPFPYGANRRFEISGLIDAAVTLGVPEETSIHISVTEHSVGNAPSETVEHPNEDGIVSIQGITGVLTVTW